MKGNNKFEFDDSKNKVIQAEFLCMAFLVDDMFITGGNDGCLYLWKNNKIIKEQKGHGDAMILCLCSHPREQKYFASGGSEGTVNLWEIKKTNQDIDDYAIEKISDCNIYISR